MSYTYFAATLPALQFGAEPTMTETVFREKCREHLSQPDFSALCALLDNGKTTNAYIKKWRNGETQIRNAVAQLRANRLGDGSAAEQWQRPHTGFDIAIINAVDSAFQEPDPMRRDSAIERIRWNLASELAGFNPFSLEAIFSYAIQLTILIRSKGTDAEKGIARLHEMRNIQAASEE